ncbi:helix-turn-helix transcriptional regulator [Sulfuricurvum sp.]|uniref:helix-turn-helix domain-containing protein n=1 Tax=Sulfuricurvum sp. TaxID=2025608 RepID=UPI0019868224|nr:helix-turn-helix transcriptional regulator [Sulfuricurvum sp.]MBD3806581.1 helix-turn-helix transcriptional regulator [Sulfuricurvum sp.]
MKMTTLSELKTQLMQDPEFKQGYDALDEEFQLIATLIDMREKSGLTQEQIAQKMGTQKSNISRLESGNANPGWKTLQNYAHACGFRIQLQYTQ